MTKTKGTRRHQRYLVQPNTYTVSCSPALMTDDELRRAIGRAFYAHLTTVDVDALPALRAQYTQLTAERDRRAR